MSGLDQDSIHIHNLSLPFPILAPNVWGDIKAQPALISLDLHLRSGFGSAANRDRLDSSTIHYGVLAKQIRATSCEGTTLEEALERSLKAVEKLANGVLAKCRITLALPKGSMLGERVEVIEQKVYGMQADRWRSLSFMGVRIPVLIGVNAYERKAKQPLIIDFKASFDMKVRLIDLFGFEGHLVDAIENTSFETLETLMESTVRQLRKDTLDRLLPGGRITLRVRKPMAITFADAPMVEVTRQIPMTPAITNNSSSEGQGQAQRLAATVSELIISKPYQ